MYALATKTTGLKPELHEVIELTIRSVETGIYVSYKIKPEKPENYTQQVQDINGISAKAAENFMPKDKASSMILESWSGLHVLGHNCIFDYQMLKATFGIEFVKTLYGVDFIDLLSEAQNFDLKLLKDGKKKLFKNYKLKTLCEALKIKYEEKTEALVGVYNALKNASNS